MTSHSFSIFKIVLPRHTSPIIPPPTRQKKTTSHIANIDNIDNNNRTSSPRHPADTMNFFHRASRFSSSIIHGMAATIAPLSPQLLIRSIRLIDLSPPLLLKQNSTPAIIVCVRSALFSSLFHPHHAKLLIHPSHSWILYNNVHHACSY